MKYIEKYLYLIPLIFSFSIVLLYFLTGNKILPVLVVIILFFIPLLIIYFLDLTDKLEFFIAFLILYFSFFAFSAFPGNNYLEEYNYILLAFLFAILFILKQFRSESYKVSFSKSDIFLISIFLILFCISVAINTQDLFDVYGFSKIVLLLLSGYLMVIYIPRLMIENIELVNLFLKSLIYFGIATGFVGIVTVFLDSINLYNIYPGTAISFFKHPNATSSIYNYTIPPVFYFLFFKKKIISDSEKIIFISGLVIMIAGLLLTFSRVGIVSIGLSVLIISFGYSRRIFWLTVFLLPVIGLFFLSDFITSKGASTIIGRAGLLATTIEMFNSSWFGTLWGFGTISTIKVFQDIKISLNVTDENNVPHNVFVYFILQFGLIAAIPLYIFISKIFIKSFYKLIKVKNQDLFVISFSICFSMVFKNLAEDLLFYPEFILFYLFLIFFGLITLSVNKINIESNLNNLSIINSLS